MLVLVTLLLMAFLIATAVIWLYRLIFRRRATSYTLGVRPDSTMAMAMKINDQQGYARVGPGYHKRAQTPAQLVKLRSARGELKVPWGW